MSIKSGPDFLLQKLEERCAELVGEVPDHVGSGEGVDGGDTRNVDEKDPEVYDVPKAVVMELSPQELAQANEFLANFEGKQLGDLVQIYAALQGAMTAVPDNERIILEYVLQKLSVIIAELEQ